jgi:hypothetical protein
MLREVALPFVHVGFADAAPFDVRHHPLARAEPAVGGALRREQEQGTVRILVHQPADGHMLIFEERVRRLVVQGYQLLVVPDKLTRNGGLAGHQILDVF